MERFFGQFRQGEHGGAVAKEYVSFKAGRCDVTDKGNNKFLITPDRRKGTVSLVKHQDELQHLQWKDRATNTVVEDVIIMGDATFSKINTGRPKDRVYLLQFSGGSSRRFFFWMQTKSDDKDENNAKKLNQYIQDPNMEVEAPPPPGGAAGGGNLQNVESILASMLGGAQAGAQAQPPQAPAQARPAGTSAAAPSSGTAGARATGQLTSADLQRAMLNISQMHAQQQAVNLAEVVNADEVLRSGVLRDPAVQEQLIPLLAEGQQNPEELEAIMRSPQLRSTLSSLTAALQTDNFNSIMSNFGLDPTRGMDALNRGNTIEAFLQSLLALQRDQSAEEEGEEGKQDEGKQS